MKVLYFGGLRAAIGIGEEDVSPPAGTATLAQLAEWLKTRSPKHEAAFSRSKLIRAAINQDFAPMDRSFAATDEIAFFPPVTGGAA